jgi:hypothetical protein
MRIRVEGGELPCSSGVQLGSQYPFNPLNEQIEIFDDLTESHISKLAEPLDFARVMVLDKWLGNADARQAIFMRKRRSRLFRTMLCCDLSYVVSLSEGAVSTSLPFFPETT